MWRIELKAMTFPIKTNCDHENMLAEIIGVCRGKEVSKKGLLTALKSGHTSLLEHISFTWRCEGWSRNMLLELERHRIGVSFTVESTRSVDFRDKGEMVVRVPGEPGREPDSRIQYVMKMVRNLYCELLSEGIPMDEVRDILPGGLLTNFYMTANLRALMHLWDLRLCKRAHAEIREFAGLLLDYVKPYLPDVCELAGPPCKRGECKEAERCDSYGRATLQ